MMASQEPMRNSFSLSMTNGMPNTCIDREGPTDWDHRPKTNIPYSCVCSCFQIVPV